MRVAGERADQGPYLISVELSFLDEAGCHVLGLGLLLHRVVLGLVVENRILTLRGGGGEKVHKTNIIFLAMLVPLIANLQY